MADLQLLAADGSVRQALPLRVGANRVGRTAAQTDCVIDNPTVSVGHAVLDIAAQPASVSASSLSNPFFTARHTLLDLDCIHLTDLGSTNHTHLASSTFPRSLTAAPAPVRLSRNKPRLLHHGQYFFVGNQCCRFVLWKYEEGVALALKEKERRASVDTAASTQDVLGPEPGETQLMTIGDVDEDSPVEPGAAVVPSPVYTASGERAEQQRFATAYGRDDEGGFEPDFADDSNYQTLQSNDYEEDAVLAPAQAAPEGAVPVEEATSREPIAVDGGSQRRPVEEAVTGAGSEPTELSAASNSTPLDMTLPPSHPSQTDSTQDRLRGDRSLKAYDAGSEPGGLLSPNATQPLPAADVASDHGVVSTPSMGTLDGRKASARSRRQSPVEAASAKADEERRVAEERTRQEEDAHKRAEDAERLRKEADDTQRALDARREEMHRQEAAEQRRLSEDLQRKREAKEKERKEREDHTEAERVKREGQEENERQQAAHERRERKLREDTDEKEEEERQRQLQLKKQKEDSAQPAKKQQENQETEERDKREREEQKHLEFARQAEEVPKLEALKEQQRQHAATLTKQADWRPKPTKRLAMAAQNAADDGAAAPPTPRRGKRSAEDGSPERTKPAGGGKKRKGAGKAEKLAEERAAGVVDVLTPEVEDMREVEAVVQPPAPAVQPTSVRPDRRANATLRRSSRSRSAAHGTDGEDDDDAVAAQPITSTQFTTAHWRPIRPQQLASPPEPTAHPREDGSGQRQQPHQVESADTTDTDRTAASVPKGSEPLAKVEQLDNVDVAAVDDEKTKAVGSAAAEHEDGAPMELDQLPAFVGPDANVPRGLRSEKTQEALDVLDDMDTARALTSPFHGLTTVAEGDAVEPSSNRAVRGRKRKTAQKPAPEDDSPPEPSGESRDQRSVMGRALNSFLRSLLHRLFARLFSSPQEAAATPLGTGGECCHGRGQGLLWCSRAVLPVSLLASFPSLQQRRALLAAAHSDLQALHSHAAAQHAPVHLQRARAPLHRHGADDLAVRHRAARRHHHHRPFPGHTPRV